MTGVPPTRATDRPLIAHVVLSFDYGGLENGLANLINGLPEDAFRHAVIALSAVTDFRRRIQRSDVSFHALGKQPGKDPGAYVRLFRLLRTLHPEIVHSRNLSTIEAALVARLAGAPFRIHSEHGWDVFDPDGASRKYRALRRILHPSIDRFVAVSRELENWLTTAVGVPANKVARICNGVNTERFHPNDGAGRRMSLAARFPPQAVVVGTVIRFSAIKDPLNLVEAFIEARQHAEGAALRLVMIGDGELRAPAEERLSGAGLTADAWLPGSRDDIPELMREFDVFALGSRREGISNTVLEAMSTGLPVVATATGGNRELVQDGTTGRLVSPGSRSELARALLEYACDGSLRESHGREGRRRAEGEFSLRRMIMDYEALYSSCFNGRRAAA